MPAEYFMPSVLPDPNFNASRDCEALNKAMQGVGCDEAGLINVLCHRSWQQRCVIKRFYTAMYGKTLDSEIEGETSGNFRKVLVRLLKTPVELAAFELHEAIEGLGTDEDCLNEIICTKTGDELREIEAEYKKLYNATLRDDLRGDTSGFFQLMLLRLLENHRPAHPAAKPDVAAATADAKSLYEAAEKVDEAVFVEILADCSFSHLQTIFAIFTKNYKKDICEVIKTKFNGDLRDALVACVSAIQNRVGYFATRLHYAMEGIGTKDAMLLRIIVSRCDFDLGAVKTVYAAMYNVPLWKDVEEETSGDYKQALLSLIGDPKQSQTGSTEPAKKPEEQGQKAPVTNAQPPKLPEVKPVPVPTVAKVPGGVYAPTVVPEPNFNAKQDCETLHKAMEGLGTDEAALIGVLCRRSWQQRCEINYTYKQMYKKDLAKEIRSETSGDFYKVLIRLLKNPVELAAYELHEAIEGLGTDEECLNEIICTRSPQELREIATKYKEVYGATLDWDVLDDTSGFFGELLAKLIKCNRPADSAPDMVAAADDARALYLAGEQRVGTDEKKFVEILSSRSYSQLRAVFDCYTRDYKKDIVDVIKSEFTSDLQDALPSVVAAIRNPIVYFANRLYNSMEGIGTKDRMLLRIIVSHCDFDLKAIKQEYVRLYNVPLAKSVEDETSGDYKKALLALLGHEETGNDLNEQKTVAGGQLLAKPGFRKSILAPTVVPIDKFDAKKDCEAIHKAMEGRGCNEAALIDVLCRRSWQQRCEIKRTYKRMYNTDLDKEIDSETKGHFYKILVRLIKDPVELAAFEIHEAIKGLGTDEECLNEIICTRSSLELKEIAAKYQEMYKVTISAEVAGDTSGAFAQLLGALLQCNRPADSTQANLAAAAADARALIEGLAKRSKDAEDAFVNIVSRRSFSQLRAVFDSFSRDYKKDIGDAIKAKFNGDLHDALQAVVGAIRNPQGYFAARLNQAMKGLGTKDAMLLRIIVSRCDFDLGEIKSEYARLYGKTLSTAVEDETSGDYKRALLVLIGDQTKPIPQPRTDIVATHVAQAPAAPQQLSAKPPVTVPGATAPVVQAQQPEILVPTLLPFKNFNEEKDCEALHKAMEGKGCDKDAMINVLCRRTWQQRKQIEKAYKRMYNKDLDKEIDSEMSGDLFKVFVRLLKTPLELAAFELHEALKGAGTDEDCLIDILCTKPSAELRDIDAKYQEHDIADDTSGSFAELLSKLLKVTRPVDSEAKPDLTAADARALYEAGEMRKGTDKTRFIDVFTGRSFSQLRAIFDAYARDYKHDIVGVIKAEFNGDTEKALVAIVGTARNRIAYFASRLHDSMKGLGTRDRMLVRLIVSHCEVDLGNIRQEYLRMHEKMTLTKAVEADTSGHYRDALCALIGE